MKFEFTAPLWKVVGDSAWHFITVPEETTDDIDEISEPYQRGFGSVRVEVTVGGSVWRTSLFPSNEVKAFVLPMKKAVRVAERLSVGEPVHVCLTLIDLPEST